MDEIKTIVCNNNCDERINKLLHSGWTIVYYNTNFKTREFVMKKKHYTKLDEYNVYHSTR